MNVGMKRAIRRQVYDRHFMTTVEISERRTLTDAEYLALKRDQCEVHKGEFCDCTEEDFTQRTMKMMLEVFSKPLYLPFIKNRG